MKLVVSYRCCSKHCNERQSSAMSASRYLFLRNPVDGGGSPSHVHSIARAELSRGGNSARIMARTTGRPIIIPIVSITAANASDMPSAYGEMYRRAQPQEYCQRDCQIHC